MIELLYRRDVNVVTVLSLKEMDVYPDIDSERIAQLPALLFRCSAREREYVYWYYLSMCHGLLAELYCNERITMLQTMRRLIRTVWMHEEHKALIAAVLAEVLDVEEPTLEHLVLKSICGVYYELGDRPGFAIEADGLLLQTHARKSAAAVAHAAAARLCEVSMPTSEFLGAVKSLIAEGLISRLLTKLCDICEEILGRFDASVSFGSRSVQLQIAQVFENCLFNNLSKNDAHTELSKLVYIEPANSVHLLRHECIFGCPLFEHLLNGYLSNEILTSFVVRSPTLPDFLVPEAICYNSIERLGSEKGTLKKTKGTQLVLHG